MKVSIEDGKICHQTTVRKRLEKVSEVWIVDETYDFETTNYVVFPWLKQSRLSLSHFLILVKSLEKSKVEVLLKRAILD